MSVRRCRLMHRVFAPAAALAAVLALLPAAQAHATELPVATPSVSALPALPPVEQARVMEATRDSWADFLKRHSDFGGEGTSHDLATYNITIEKQEEVYRVTLSPKQAITHEVDTETGSQLESETTVIYFDISRKSFSAIRMRARHVSETSPSFGASPAPQVPSN